MLSWIYAADTPYAVIVDDDGRFVLEDAPPGTYTVTAWHPYLGSLEQEVTLEPDGTSETRFEFSSN